MPTTTYYPFSDVLEQAIAAIVLAQVVPAINAGMTARLSEESAIPQFSAAQVVRGELDAVQQLTITTCIAAESLQWIAADTMKLVFAVSVKLLLPAVADSFPEDYAAVQCMFRDSMRDVFCKPSTIHLQPKDGDGNTLLAANSAFNQVRIIKTLGPMTKKTPSGSLVLRYLDTTIAANITYNLQRPSPLGD